MGEYSSESKAVVLSIINRNAKYTYLVAGILYFLIARFFLNEIVISPGVIGIYHDWYLNQFPEMIYAFAVNGLFIWDSQVGNMIYPLDWIFRATLIPFSFMGGEVISKGLIIVFITFSGLTAFALGRYFRLGLVASFGVGLIYVFSPIIFTRVISGHSYYLLAYLLAPLILLTFLRASEKNRKALFIVTGLFLSLAVVQIHFLFMIPLILIIFSIIDLPFIRRNFAGLGIALGICFLVTLSPVVLSQVMVKTPNIGFNIVQLFSILESYPASELLKSFRLLGYEIVPYSYTNLGTSKDYYHTGNNIPESIFYLDFLLPIVGFSALIFRRDKYTISLATIAVIGLFILKGANPPFSDLFSFLFVNGLYVFREIWHVSFLYAFSITFLCGFFFDSLASLFNQHQHQFRGPTRITRSFAKFGLPIFLMSIIAVANGFPLLTGDFAGYVQTFNLPETYRELYNSFSNDIDYSNTLILPLFSPIKYDGLRLVGTDPYVRYFEGSILPTSISPGHIPSGTSSISAWLLSVMHNDKTSNIGEILSGLGIKYVVLRKDFESSFANFTYTDLNLKSKWQESLDEFLESQKDLNLIENNSEFKIYRNNIESSKFFIPSRSAIGLTDFNQLSLLANGSSLADFEIYPSYSFQRGGDDGAIFLFDSPEEANIVDNASFIELGQHATSIYSSAGWTTNKDWFAYDHLLASRVNEGLFSTMHEAKTEFTLPPLSYLERDSELFIKAIKWPKGGTVVITVNGSDNYLDLYSLDRKFEIFKLYGNISSGSPTRISILNEDGANYVEGLYITKGKEGHKSGIGVSSEKLNDSGVKRIIGTEDIDYQDNNDHLNKNPSFETVVYSGQNLPAFWIDIHDQCQRAFKCISDPTDGWKDNSSLKVSTSESLNSKWSAISGNVIDVVPDENYNLITHMKLNEYAVQSHIVLEGYNNTSQTWYQITHCPTGTDGPLEWNMFSCEITIPGDTTKIRFLLNAGWSSSLKNEAITWFDAIYLMNADSSSESARQLEPNRRVFGSQENTVVNYTRIDPSEWQVYVNASGSFTLAFAEPFDEGWIAELSKDGKAITTISSDPLYGSINSFHIDKSILDGASASSDKSKATADDDTRIVIRYERQYWFDIGIVISICTLVVSLMVIWLSTTKKIKINIKK